MSVKIHRSEITPEIQEKILQHLLLKKKDQAPWLKKKQYYANANEEVLTYYLIDGEYVYLPLVFATTLYQKTFNPDSNYPTVNFQFTGTLYDYQQEIVSNCYQHLQCYGTTILGIYPGAGKTVMCAKLASQLRKLTIVFCHRDILLPQWSGTFRDFTNANVWIVGETPPASEVNVIICMDQRFDKIPAEVKKLIGCVIVDEAHTFCTPSRVSVLLGTTPSYFIAATATLDRDDGMDSMIRLITGNHGVFKHSTKAFTVYRLLTGITVEYKLNVRGETDWSDYVSQISSHELRNRMILTLTKIYSDKKILILIHRKKQAEFLVNSLQNLGESVASLYGNQKSYLDSRVLIGTLSKIGLAFDEKSFCPNFGGKRIDLLIMGSSIKKHSNLDQAAGRVFRALMPTIIDMVDEDRIAKRHFSIRKQWYDSRNSDIRELTLTWNKDESLKGNIKEGELRNLDEQPDRNAQFVDRRFSHSEMSQFQQQMAKLGF